MAGTEFKTHELYQFSLSEIGDLLELAGFDRTLIQHFAYQDAVQYLIQHINAKTGRSYAEDLILANRKQWEKPGANASVSFQEVLKRDQSVLRQMEQDERDCQSQIVQLEQKVMVLDAAAAQYLSIVS